MRNADSNAGSLVDPLDTGRTDPAHPLPACCRAHRSMGRVAAKPHL